MKVFVVFSVFFVASLATPLGENIPLDWSKISPKNLNVRPEDFGGVSVETRAPGTRVINGREANRNEFPYQAALIMDSNAFCGGSLISNKWVVSAAHCTTDAATVQVILGAHSVRVEEPTQVIRVTNIIFNHPAWGTGVMSGDISLVQIDAVQTNAVIRPITLAPEHAPNYGNTYAVLSGWGRKSDASNSIASVLQTVTLQVMTPLACRLRWIITGDEHICTSGSSDNGSVGACNGDSGGPLVINGFQVGIVSFGSRTCEGGSPTVYSRVSHFRPWVREVTLGEI